MMMLFFGVPFEGDKRGRGIDKTKVLAGLSLNQKGHPLCLKMEVFPDVKGKTIVEFANRTIATGSAISSDAYKSYKALAEAELEYQHKPQKFNPTEDPDHLHWLHTVISNAKAFIAGTFHGLDPKHLQAYLSEFCYRFNRKDFKGHLFNRLLSCCASTHTFTCSALTA